MVSSPLNLKWFDDFEFFNDDAYTKFMMWKYITYYLALTLKNVLRKYKS